MDPMFWATKQHFHMTAPQFYNFPCKTPALRPACAHAHAQPVLSLGGCDTDTFGYLFALGVYALRAEAPTQEAYHAQYTALLRDTGRMTAEELVQVRCARVWVRALEGGGQIWRPPLLLLRLYKFNAFHALNL